MSQEKHSHTNLSIKNRELLSMNGITNIESFDPDLVTLATEDGQIVVEGAELKIESLVRESGEIEIKGSISGVFYSRKKKKEGRFKKLFS